MIIKNIRQLLPISIVFTAVQITYSQEKPNIIVILADDMGWGDAGCYGGKMIPTPNIDRLAKEGVRFTNGYATAPISGPSRYGILTGAYQQRFGIQDNTDAWAEIPGVTERIPASQKLLHETLKEGGYRTAIFGKYNLPGYPKTTFDETYSVMHFGGDYFPDANGHYKGVDEPKAIGDVKRILWGPERPGDEYLTDRIGRQAVEFISKNKSNPFFMYVGFNAPHSPMQAKKEHKQIVSHLQHEALQYYAAMLFSMDENVGKILKELDKQKLARNTLIIFLSDNGPTYAYNVDWPAEWPKELLGSAGNLSGHKGQLLEGGIREPYILRWQGKLKAGSVYNRPVSSLDIYPTACAAAKIGISKTTQIDGVNLLPYLQNFKKGEPHKELFWYINENGAVRSGKWKLNILKNKVTLFNLDVDESEKNDLSIQEAIVKDQLLVAWKKFCAKMPAPCNQAQRNKVAFTQQENSLSKGAAKVPQTNSPKVAIIEMLAVEGGTFTMGDTRNEGNPDEKPTQTVTISSFRIAKTEVTQKQWITVMGTNPSKLVGENKPVETVSWYDATVFCNKLSIREGLTPCYSINGNTNPVSWGKCPYEIPNTSKIIGDSARWNNLTCDWTANGYRLPTEAEWEFAAGGGASHTRYAGTSDKDKLGDFAWTTDNSQQTTHDVAGKLPNSFGIFDMTGNVHEWCWDWYGPYTSEPKNNPKGVKRSSNRTDHGGCWKSYPLSANNVVRVCYRNFRNPGHLTYAIGFRVAQNKQN